jgi:hypothetical protein
VRWPEDFLAVVAVLIALMTLVWWRNRFPSKYDVTLHRDDLKPDARKPPPDSGDESDGG